MEHFKPKFPTLLHEDAARSVNSFFTNCDIDTILVVNSCARRVAVPESDLDFCIIANEDMPAETLKAIKKEWLEYSASDASILKYKKSTPFAHLHVDIINGVYIPTAVENGEPIDYFEVTIGNQIRYAVPFTNGGDYYMKLQEKWLPYYDENIRLQRLHAIMNSCNYDLEHIPYIIKRNLYFHAFDTLYNAFQKYLQALFISAKVYPIAYNKWIKYQVTFLLNKPDLYPLLLPVLSIKNIESKEINEKAKLIHQLLKSILSQSTS